jgi:flavin reductase (DIM6/NTAB) family NADH-FMN oxidoreductase RutF
VNLLKVEDNGMALAAQFVQPRRGEKIRGRSEEAAHREHDKLAGVDYTLTDRGCPLLDDALARLECEAQEFLPAGDHTLVLGRVLDGRVVASGEPLTSTYTGWTYSG